MSKSTTRRRSRKATSKPAKPYEGYPLFPHDSGRWAKKIRGRLSYFGRWARRENGKLVRVPGDGWQEALELYEKQRDDLHAGRTPRNDDDKGPTLADLCNRFLETKEDLVDSGELSPSTFGDYRLATDELIDHFGRYRLLTDLRPEDFAGFRKKLAKGRSGKGRGLVALGNMINLTRIVLKFAYDEAMIDRPIRFGQSFAKPSKKNLQHAKNEAGPNLFTREEVLAILEVADPIMKAQVLLGLNCGFGNTDCANLPQSAIDFASGWLEFPRPKTAVQRRIPLWPETLKALREAIQERPKPKDDEDANLCFLTREGRRVVRMQPHKTEKGKWTRRDSLGDRFNRLLKKLEINGRKRLGFYTVRHVHATVAGESKDQVACDHIMGHADQSMAARYREDISDERLKAVCKHVRKWLWPKRK